MPCLLSVKHTQKILYHIQSQRRTSQGHLIKSYVEPDNYKLIEHDYLHYVYCYFCFALLSGCSLHFLL